MKIFEVDGKQEMYGRSGFKTFIFDDHQLFAKPKMEPDDSGLDDIKEYSFISPNLTVMWSIYSDTSNLILVKPISA